ncbi:MAG: sigma-70 family RNA polymerase sigma factor [candidate division WOR-3 bacterium]
MTENLSKYYDEEDAKLVARVKMGDLTAFDELVQRHEVRIYNLCYRMLHDQNDAHELAQDTFVKAYRAIGKFDGRSSFSTWLYRIAVNNCINFLKKRPKELNLESSYEGISSYNPEATYRRRIMSKILHKAIEMLPEVQRAVFTLKQIEGLSYKEIADHLGKSVGTIKASHHQAVINLKNYLKNKI